MRFVVVLAHPNPDSFSHAAARHACDALQAKGHHVDLLDLYALGFRAAMTKDERLAYHSHEAIIDPMVEAHALLIRAADGLVFVYPTWWSSLPAILKGWLERVLVPGVGFVFNSKGKVRPGLTNIRHLIGISTYGSPRSYVRLVNDNGRRTILRTLRIITARRTRCRWLGLYSVDTSGARERAAFLDRIDTELGAL
jgi:putative NADPH-quinone reductase